MAILTSIEPATGETLWTGEEGDPDAEVASARAAWAGWASRSLSYRVETLRRFANVTRSKIDAFADLIARETGKPLWEARTEVEAIWSAIDTLDDWAPLQAKIAAIRRMGEAYANA